MKRLFMVHALLVSVLTNCPAQQYLTKNGYIRFHSKTAMEDILAENKQVYAVVDLGKKNIAFMLLLKGFIFPKELMQEHFNENYVESDKYPKAIFSGQFSSDITPDKDGMYSVTITGSLNLHGVSQPVKLPATLEIKEGALTGLAHFSIKPEDYQIKIPSLVRDKIANEIEVEVNIHTKLIK